MKSVSTSIIKISIFCLVCLLEPVLSAPYEVSVNAKIEDDSIKIQEINFGANEVESSTVSVGDISHDIQNVYETSDFGSSGDESSGVETSGNESSGQESSGIEPSCNETCYLLNSYCDPDDNLCHCDAAFEGDPYNSTIGCTDLNECLPNAKFNATCPVNSFCNNTFGGWECLCEEGYQGDSTMYGCFPICNETLFCGPHTTCKTVNDKVYIGEGQFLEYDFDHCICDAGLTGDAYNTTVGCSTDINECTTMNSTCSTNAYCNNTFGSYVCTCMNGYLGDPYVIGCECAPNGIPLFCGENTICDLGEDECKCIIGYQGNPYDLSIGCTEISPTPYVPSYETECAGFGGNLTCGENANCDSFPGQDECRCIIGYQGNPYDLTTGCTDVNECEPNSQVNVTCGINAYCDNLVGSYQCQCINGTQGDPYSRCEAPCSATCGPNTDCVTENNGPDQCQCKTGYAGNPYNSTGCSDIDECITGGANCATNAYCINTNGSYSCMCNQGYTGYPYIRGCTATTPSVSTATTSTMPISTTAPPSTTTAYAPVSDNGNSATRTSIKFFTVLLMVMVSVFREVLFFTPC